MFSMSSFIKPIHQWAVLIPQIGFDQNSMLLTYYFSMSQT